MWGRRRWRSAIVARPHDVSPCDASFLSSPPSFLPPDVDGPLVTPAPRLCSLACAACFVWVCGGADAESNFWLISTHRLAAAAAAAAVVVFVVGVVLASLLFRLLAPGRRSFSVVVVFVVVVVRPSSASWLLVGRPSPLLRCLLWRPPVVGPLSTRIIIMYVDVVVVVVVVVVTFISTSYPRVTVCRGRPLTAVSRLVSVVVVVVVRVRLDALRRLSFLDATRRVVVVVLVVVVLVVVAVTKNTPYRGVTVRWARPLTAISRLRGAGTSSWGWHVFVGLARLRGAGTSCLLSVLIC